MSKKLFSDPLMANVLLFVSAFFFSVVVVSILIPQHPVFPVPHSPRLGIELFASAVLLGTGPYWKLRYDKSYPLLFGLAAGTAAAGLIDVGYILVERGDLGIRIGFYCCCMLTLGLATPYMIHRASVDRTEY